MFTVDIHIQPYTTWLVFSKPLKYVAFCIPYVYKHRRGYELLHCSYTHALFKWKRRRRKIAESNETTKIMCVMKILCMRLYVAVVRASATSARLNPAYHKIVSWKTVSSFPFTIFFWVCCYFFSLLCAFRDFGVRLRTRKYVLWITWCLWFKQFNN